MITIETKVNAPIEKVWNFWTQPEHIMNWNNASDDWHTPYAEIDLKVGGKFKSTMAAKNGSMSFDFGGNYTNVEHHSEIAYTLDDNRKVVISFEKTSDGIKITESFDPENVHPEEFQKQGWQSILDNFKKYTETN